MPPYILENLSSPIDDPFAVMPPRDPNDDDAIARLAPMLVVTAGGTYRENSTQPRARVRPGCAHERDGLPDGVNIPRTVKPLLEEFDPT
jgi:hypothetical protein